MNRYLSLIGVLAVAGCASPVPPREHLAASPQFFHITPVRPVAELLPLALAASPPVEPGEFRPADLLDVRTRLSHLCWRHRGATAFARRLAPAHGGRRLCRLRIRVVALRLSRLEIVCDPECALREDWGEQVTATPGVVIRWLRTEQMPTCPPTESISPRESYRTLLAPLDASRRFTAGALRE